MTTATKTKPVPEFSASEAPKQQAPAVDALPERERIDPIMPSGGAPRKPNPYDPVIAEMVGGLDDKGYSYGETFTVDSEGLAKVHQSMIRRAARSAGVSVAVPVTPTEGGWFRVRYGVIPTLKRKPREGKPSE